MYAFLLVLNMNEKLHQKEKSDSTLNPRKFCDYLMLTLNQMVVETGPNPIGYNEKRVNEM